MKKILAAVLCALLIVFASPYCLSEDGTEEVAKLIKEAKEYIDAGDSEKAVSALDAAFESADSAGGHSALMEIGDLYLGADPSLKDKAMRAWTASGRWKCR